jgi:hypothetical protein
MNTTKIQANNIKQQNGVCLYISEKKQKQITKLKKKILRSHSEQKRNTIQNLVKPHL